MLEPLVPLTRWQHCTFNKARDSRHRGSLTRDTNQCVVISLQWGDQSDLWRSECDHDHSNCGWTTVNSDSLGGVQKLCSIRDQQEASYSKHTCENGRAESWPESVALAVQESAEEHPTEVRAFAGAGTAAAWRAAEHPQTRRRPVQQGMWTRHCDHTSTDVVSTHGTAEPSPSFPTLHSPDQTRDKPSSLSFCVHEARYVWRWRTFFTHLTGLCCHFVDTFLIPFSFSGFAARLESASVIRDVGWTEENSGDQVGAWLCARRVHQRHKQLLPRGDCQVLLAWVLGATSRQGGTVRTRIRILCLNLSFIRPKLFSRPAARNCLNRTETEI